MKTEYEKQQEFNEYAKGLLNREIRYNLIKERDEWVPKIDDITTDMEYFPLLLLKVEEIWHGRKVE